MMVQVGRNCAYEPWTAANERHQAGVAVFGNLAKQLNPVVKHLGQDFKKLAA